MKKLLTVFALIGLFAVGNMSYVKAQEPAQSDTATDVAVEEEAQSFTDEVVEDEPAASTADTSAEIVTTRTFHQQIKDTFIEGGPFFMSFILICLILGLALSIERIIYLNMASINKNKFRNSVAGKNQRGVLLCSPWAVRKAVVSIHAVLRGHSATALRQWDGIPSLPTRAPTMPPTIAAVLSASPPHCKMAVIAFV